MPLGRLRKGLAAAAATSVAHANPQFGAGGSTQSYVADLPGRPGSGDLVPVGPDGNALPVSVSPSGGVTVTAPNGQLIDLTSFGPSTNPSGFTPDDF